MSNELLPVFFSPPIAFVIGGISMQLFSDTLCMQSESYTLTVSGIYYGYNNLCNPAPFAYVHLNAEVY